MGTKEWAENLGIEPREADPPSNQAAEPPADDDPDDVPSGTGFLRDALIHRARVVVPLRRFRAPAHIYVDDQFYASFHSVEAAEEAASLMKQRWAAVQGRRLFVVRG